MKRPFAALWAFPFIVVLLGFEILPILSGMAHLSIKYTKPRPTTPYLLLTKEWPCYGSL